MTSTMTTVQALALRHAIAAGCADGDTFGPNEVWPYVERDAEFYRYVRALAGAEKSGWIRRTSRKAHLVYRLQNGATEACRRRLAITHAKSKGVAFG